MGPDPVHVKRWRETLPNGVSYFTLDRIDGSTYDTTGVYVVPAGHFFAMGDNRDNSLDSRVPPASGGVGYVPFENLIGRAKIDLLLDQRRRSMPGRCGIWPSSLRWNRLFTIVR